MLEMKNPVLYLTFSLDAGSDFGVQLDSWAICNGRGRLASAMFHISVPEWSFLVPYKDDDISTASQRRRGSFSMDDVINSEVSLVDSPSAVTVSSPA